MTNLVRICRTFTFVLAAITASLTAIAAEVAGVKLDDTVRVANQELVLNGAGVRYKVIFKVYIAGLYLPQKKSTVPEVLALQGAKRVTLAMLREVSNEELGRGFVTGIQQNLDKVEKTKLVPQMQRFGELFASIPELKKGDVITADWVPKSGTIIYHNGKQITEPIPDVAFYNALLKIWLGEKPADARLKPALLGE